MIAAALSIALAAASTGHRPTHCVVSSAGERPYAGPCRFLPAGKGSFDIEPVGRRIFSGEVTGITVSLTGPRAAEVRGLTTSGINSRWGPAQRSRRDPACWEGADFRVCVYR